MIKHLIRLANHLDKKGFAKEADYLDNIIKTSSEDDLVGMTGAGINFSPDPFAALSADPDRFGHEKGMEWIRSLTDDQKAIVKEELLAGEKSSDVAGTGGELDSLMHEEPSDEADELMPNQDDRLGWDDHERSKRFLKE